MHEVPSTSIPLVVEACKSLSMPNALTQFCRIQFGDIDLRSSCRSVSLIFIPLKSDWTLNASHLNLRWQTRCLIFWMGLCDDVGRFRPYCWEALEQQFDWIGFFCGKRSRNDLALKGTEEILSFSSLRWIFCRDVVRVLLWLRREIKAFRGESLKEECFAVQSASHTFLKAPLKNVWSWAFFGNIFKMFLRPAGIWKSHNFMFRL